MRRGTLAVGTCLADGCVHYVEWPKDCSECSLAARVPSADKGRERQHESIHRLIFQSAASKTPLLATKARRRGSSDCSPARDGASCARHPQLGASLISASFFHFTFLRIELDQHARTPVADLADGVV